MYRKEIIIKNIPSRDPEKASRFVEAASRHDGEVFVIKGGNKYNAKSIISVLSLSIINDDKLIIEAEGDKAEEKVNRLAEILNEV